MKSAISNLSICKVSCKTKKLKIWAQKYLIWVFLDRVLKETIFIFKGSTLELVKANIIHVKPKKTKKFGTKLLIICLHLG